MIDVAAHDTDTQLRPVGLGTASNGIEDVPRKGYLQGKRTIASLAVATHSGMNASAR